MSVMLTRQEESQFVVFGQEATTSEFGTDAPVGEASCDDPATYCAEVNWTP